MIFLIEYERAAGRTVSMTTFSDSDQERAADARLQLELDLNRRGVQHEVVLLQAENEAALRRTHARYWDDLATMIDRFAKSLSAYDVRRGEPSVVRERKE